MDFAAGVKALERAGGIERAAGERRAAGRGFEQIVQQRRSREASPAAPDPAAGFAGVCRELQAGSQTLDRIIEAARGGKRFSPQELLVLQAEIYRFVESTSLVSKAAEQAASGLHRLWQLQV